VVLSDRKGLIKVSQREQSCSVVGGGST